VRACSAWTRPARPCQVGYPSPPHAPPLVLRDAGDGAGVAGGRFGEVEDFTDDGFAGDGDEDGALEAVEAG
jgi:hypothetical protein